MSNEETTWTKAMGITYVRTTAHEVVAELEIAAHHRQAFGFVHGGVYCGLIESVASAGAFVSAKARGQRPPVGLENHTSFVRAVRSGRLRAVARPVSRGRSSQLWEGTVQDEDGHVVATGRVRLLCQEEDDGGENA